MEFASIAINAAVVAAVGLILGWLGKRRFEGVEGRFDGVDRGFEGLERRMDALEKRMDGFEASLDAMCSVLRGIALAVGARPRPTAPDDTS